MRKEKKKKKRLAKRNKIGRKKEGEFLLLAEFAIKKEVLDMRNHV